MHSMSYLCLYLEVAVVCPSAAVAIVVSFVLSGPFSHRKGLSWRRIGSTLLLRHSFDQVPLFAADIGFIEPIFSISFPQTLLR